MYNFPKNCSYPHSGVLQSNFKDVEYLMIGKDISVYSEGEKNRLPKDYYKPIFI